MINLFKALGDFLHYKPVQERPFILYTKSETIAGAFDYPEEEFQKLVNELTFFVKPDDRIVAFASYVDSPVFQQYKLDLNNPNHAAILGYAFCLAVVLQHALYQRTVINDVLQTFARNKAKGDDSKIDA